MNSLPKYVLCKTLNAFKKNAETEGWSYIATVGYFELARFEKKGFPIAILWQRTKKCNEVISGNECAYNIAPKMFRKK